MGIENEILSGIVLLIIVLIIIVGFTCYLFRNYCNKKKRERRGFSDQRRDSLLNDVNYKTTTDEASTTNASKVHTFEQILKREERSNYGPQLSVHALKFQQLQQQQQQPQSTGANDTTEQSEKRVTKTVSNKDSTQ